MDPRNDYRVGYGRPQEARGSSPDERKSAGRSKGRRGEGRRRRSQGGNLRAPRAPQLITGFKIEERMTERGDDPVGYKRPPAHTRFRSGRSGNPTGRPKRRPSFRAALLAELAAPMPAKDQQRAGSKLQALVKTLVNSAIAGEARAQSILVGALARIGDAEENEAASLTSDDRAILDAYVGGELKRRADKTDAAPSPAEENAD